MSLRGKKRDDESESGKMLSFRCPPEFRHYIVDTAKKNDVNQTKVITDALALDRDLAEMLDAERSRMEAFAKSEGLRMDKDLAEILARLVREGLQRKKS